MQVTKTTNYKFTGYTHNPFEDFRAIVLTKVLEADEKNVRDLYFSFHPDEEVENKPVEWVRKEEITDGEIPPCYFFATVVGEMFFVHYIVFDYDYIPSDNKGAEAYSKILYERYLKKNNKGRTAENLKLDFGFVVIADKEQAV